MLDCDPVGLHRVACGHPWSIPDDLRNAKAEPSAPATDLAHVVSCPARVRHSVTAASPRAAVSPNVGWTSWVATVSFVVPVRPV
jgi:hypothetical protein